MKRTSVFWLVLSGLIASTVLLAGQEARAGKIETSLEKRLLASGPDELVQVIIRPKGTLLGSGLKRQLAAQYATRADQHREAVKSLRAAADASQSLILSALASPDYSGRVTDVRNFWIDNIITARMTPSAISEMANRADVEEIIAMPAVSWVEPIPVPIGAAPAEVAGTAQPGLRAIKADSLWKLGYTGAGRLVATIDAGVDGRHRLLSPKWRGHNGYSVKESWFNPQTDDTVPRTFPGQLPTHGTNVIGIMVARDSVVSMDTLGVCYDAQWISAAAIDIVGTSIVEALQWSADPDGDPNTEEDVPDVVNNSWGLSLLDGNLRYDSTGSCIDAFWNAIDNVEAAGAVSIRNPANRTASETNAFSVGMVNALLEGQPITIDQLSSRGPSTCDLLTVKPEIVAPGYLIKTTNPGGGFTNQAYGTSFAVPHASGAVALLREYNPNATVDTIKWALLHGARYLGPLPPGPDNDWGQGLLDIMGALRLMPANTQPSLHIKRDLYNLPAPGDTSSMVIVLRSQGPAVSNVTVTLVADDPRLTVTSASASFGDFGGIGDTAGNYTNRFTFAVAADAIPGERLPVQFQIAGSGGYSKIVHGAIQVGPAQTEELYTHSAGNFRMTVSSHGTFGLEATGLAPRAGGQGYLFGDDPMQSIFEGAFLVGTDPNHVSDNVRNALGFPDANNLILEYTIHNRSGAPISALRAGLYFDWDFPWSPTDTMQAHSDSGGYDPASGLGWMNERDGKRFRGVVALTAPRTTAYRYYDNNPEIYDGFSNSEKWLAMTGGTDQNGPLNGGDGSHLIATGPFSIPTGQSISIAFAIIGDTTRIGLLTSAARARRLYGGAALTVFPTSLSFTGTVGGPNPVASELAITNGTDVSVDVNVTHHPEWASVMPASGSIPGGTSLSMSVIPLITGKAVGTYVDSVEITTTDPVKGSFHIPATLTVNPRLEMSVSPNPFNPDKESAMMTIGLSINVNVVIYDLTGQKVQDLGRFAPGAQIQWDGKSHGKTAAEGVYFCRVEGDGGFSHTFTIVLKR
ncbi:MAG: S8 family peptidase [candidate division Zixibacteria bacterium]|nr:S8 family peptidase [candidate division Zixibacteria bacterium]